MTTEVTISPTDQAYVELSKAFDHFNQHLFAGELPSCLITLQRQHDTYSYFSAQQFVAGSGQGVAHEIALNPSYFALRPAEETMGSLVREMVSLKQHANGTAGRKRYCNKEWADLMEKVGLMPTHTWEPGGNRVGDNVGFYIIEGGEFDAACRALLGTEAYRLTWLDRYPPAEDKVKSRHKADTLEQHTIMAHAETVSETSELADTGAIEPAESQLIDGEESPAYEYIDTGEDTNSESLLTPMPADADSGKIAAPAAPIAAPEPDNKPKPKKLATVDLSALQSLGVEPQARSKSPSRTKYQCPACQSNVWGKAGLALVCGSCEGAPTYQVTDGPSAQPETLES